MEIMLSKSKVNAYVTCPRQFKYIVIDEKEQETNSAAEFGNKVHKIADKFIKNNRDLKSYDDILSKLLEYESECDEDCKEHCENLAKFFYEFLVEKEYTYWRAETWMESKRYNFGGYADLILKDKEGKLLIVDYKTGRPSTVNKYKLELCYYKMLTEEMYEGKIVKNVAIYFTKSGDLSSIEFSKSKNNDGYCSLEDYNLALNYIDTLRLEVDAGRFPARRSHLCQFCSFTEDCAKDSGFME